MTAIVGYVETLGIKVKNDDYVGWLCLLLCILAFSLMINILFEFRKLRYKLVKL